MAIGGGPGPGSQIGRYAIVRRIGSGGMGEVFEGLHVELQKRVAIKTLRADRGRDPEARARFVREGKAAARVRHPNVVEVLDVDTHGDTPYLVMEYLEGVDLATWLSREPRPAVEVIVELMLPVLAAVAAAHEEGVLHRDLKPSNVFLSRTRDGRLQPKVVDFGISRVSTEADVHDVTRSNIILGTPAYMSPEQARRAREVTAASDQYALGVILYECATGRTPFEPGPALALLLRIGTGEFPPPRSLRPELPAEFEGVLLQAMALDPARRFGSVRELGRALLPFARDRDRHLWASVFDASVTLTGIRIEAPPSESTPPPPQSPTTLSSTVQERPSAASAPATRRALRVPLGIAAVLVGALGAYGVSSLTRDDRPREAPRYEVAITAQPALATVTLDGVAVGRGSFQRSFAADGVTHVLSVTAPGYSPQELVFVNAPPAVRAVELRARVAARPPQPAAAPPVQQPLAAPTPAVAPPRPAAPTVVASAAPPARSSTRARRAPPNELAPPRRASLRGVAPSALAPPGAHPPPQGANGAGNW